MTDSTPDRRPARAAATLGIRRAHARFLLALPRPVRYELLDELVRVGAGLTLAHLRALPTAERI